MRAAASAGKRAGARMPNQDTTSKPGTVSPTGGASGRAALRLGPVTPMQRILPPRTSGTAVDRVGNPNSAEPPSTAVMISGAPRYGTCTTSTPAMALNSSAHRCAPLPLPPDA